MDPKKKTITWRNSQKCVNGGGVNRTHIHNLCKNKYCNKRNEENCGTHTHTHTYKKKANKTKAVGQKSRRNRKKLEMNKANKFFVLLPAEQTKQMSFSCTIFNEVQI